MMMSAEMAYSAKDYEKALTVYKQLKDKAVSPDAGSWQRQAYFVALICWAMEKK